MGEVLTRAKGAPTDAQISKRFQATLKSCMGTKVLDLKKVLALSTEVKQFMVNHLMRCRMPVLKEFTVGLDQSWVACMGYMYEVTAHNGFVLICTCENQHKVR